MSAAKALHSLAKALEEADLARVAGSLWLALAWAAIVLAFDSQALIEAGAAAAAGAFAGWFITAD